MNSWLHSIHSVQRDYNVARAAYESAISGREQLMVRAEEIRAQEAAVEVIVDSVNDTFVILSQAVIEKSGGKLVFLKKDSRVKLIPVKTGLFNWNFTEVVYGLNEGDIVVINPDTPGLVDGVKVREK